MKTRIITISREFASGGHTIGQAVAERLGYAFYDNELISAVAKKSGLAEEFIRQNEEYASHSNSFLYQLVMSASGPSAGYPSAHQRLYEAQTRVIEDLAQAGPCVIVGRCADYILRNRDDCLNVFIHADNEFRAARILKRYGDNGKPIDQRIREMDSKRKNYYRFHTDREWGVCSHYHISLDAGKLGIDTCVRLIVDTVTECED